VLCFDRRGGGWMRWGWGRGGKWWCLGAGDRRGGRRGGGRERWWRWMWN